MKTLSPVLKYAGTVIDLLFPRWCTGCGREGEYICPSCRNDLVAVEEPFCARCGRPLTEKGVCDNCSEGWQIDGIRAPFLFGGVIRQAIHSLKYDNLRDIAPLLAGYMYDYLERHSLPADVIIPVPLHPGRLRERGYNQAALLARNLGTRTGMPVMEKRLERHKFTPSLATSPGREARREIVANAFGVNGDFTGRCIMLIDDVSTSGATLNACAAALKAAGADSVYGLVAALEK